MSASRDRCPIFEPGDACRRRTFPRHTLEEDSLSFSDCLVLGTEENVLQTCVVNKMITSHQHLAVGLSFSGKRYVDSLSSDETAKLDRMRRPRWEVICGNVQMETLTCILLQSSLKKPPHSFIHGVSWKV